MAPQAEAQKQMSASNMSAMGRLAHHTALKRSVLNAPGSIVRARVSDDNLPTAGVEDVDSDGVSEFPQDDDTPNIAGGQAETSLALDSTGQHIIIGFNDTRGFNFAQTDVSGFMYSDDGGVTFTDGGQLPVNVGTNTTIAGAVYPEPFGDPELVYLGGSKFAYFSILLKARTATATAQTMCVHLSNDNGHTWKGPYEVTPATTPHTTGDAADKEFAGRDPETGRVMMSWSNFTTAAFAPGGVEISRTYSDDLATAAQNGTAPTWSTRAILGARAIDGQSSVPRFAGNGSNLAYVAWRTFSGLNGGNSVAVSNDNGVTFGAPVDLVPSFYFPMDQVQGNDRTNNSPGMDVDNSGGPFAGNAYVVYTDDNSHDGGDIAFQRSTNGGASWSSPVHLNARPGSDRAQWFPWVDVDQSTGRIHVFYYDQGIDTSGDVSEVSHVYSDDGGVTWSAQSPITERPFHAGYGNDTGQPNIGDYNQSRSFNGDWMLTYAYSPQVINFQNGQPSASMNFPDVNFKRMSSFPVALRLGTLSVNDSSGDGLIDPGETVGLLIPVQSYANNAPSFTGVGGTLSTTTANVTVTQGSSSYADVPNGGSSTNSTPYSIKLSHAFVPGTPIELQLSVNTAQGTTLLDYTLKTGQGVVTPVYSMDFEAGAPGWTVAHGGGANQVNWGIATGQFSSAPYNNPVTNHIAFHINAADGVGGTGNPTRFERLFSPVLNTPSDSDYVQLDFDVMYNSEDDPTYNIQAFDGFCLRITDQTNSVAFPLRSVLAEAFAQDFTTDSIKGYPKHLPRNSSTSYFQDMAVWAGYSAGIKHVSMKLPGMAGVPFQLRFEYTQDSGVSGSSSAPAGTTKGVGFDNLVIKSVHLVDPPHAAPTVNAGADQTHECVGPHNFVTLDGSASASNSGGPLTYEWKQGATVVGNAAIISVDAPHDTTTPYTLTVTDAHDNSASADTHVTIQDTTPPMITLNGTDPMTVECATGYSEPGATANDICDGPVAVNISGSVIPTVKGVYTITYKAVDGAGNPTTKTRTVNVVDTTPPVVALVGASVIKVNFGDTFVDPGATSNDSCDGNISAGIVVTGSVNTSAFGTYTLTYTSTDGSTNHAAVQRTVKVIFAWTNLLQPVNDDGSSIFKLGSTIPLKFQLTGGGFGQIITAKVYVAKVSNNVTGSDVEATSTSAADSGNTFRYDSTAQQYIFNLATKPLSAGTWQIRVDLGDGETHTVLISLK